jgi:hypothetical protein
MKCVKVLSLLLFTVGCSGSGGGQATVPDTSSVADVQVQGLPANQTVETDSLSLRFELSTDPTAQGFQLDRYECQLDLSGAFVACNGEAFVWNGLVPGKTYSLAVRAVLRRIGSQEMVYTSPVQYEFSVSPNARTRADQTLSNTVLLGSAYKVKTPDGMHITEYSTSKTTGVLTLFRVLPESDPFYLNNFVCNRGWDRVAAAISPAGETLNYCHSTPTRDAYKLENEYRLAHNHVELATDTRNVRSDWQERLAIAVYDPDFEFMTSRSRFYNACQNSEVNVLRIPMLENFFIGRTPEHVNFWYCDTYQADPDGEPVLWRVGAFLDHDEWDWQCATCSYPRAVEAVYMVRANAAVFMPASFGRLAQERFMGIVDKLTP